MRVLVYETWPPMRRLLRAVASAAGFQEFAEADAGEAAAATVEEEAIGIVLMGAGVSPAARRGLIDAIEVVPDRPVRVVAVGRQGLGDAPLAITVPEPLDVDNLRQVLEVLHWEVRGDQG